MIEALKLDSHLLLIREINKLLKEPNLSSLIDSLCQILKRERNYVDVISGFVDEDGEHDSSSQKRINNIHCIKYAVSSGKELIVECGKLNCKGCPYRNSEYSSAILTFESSAGRMILCIISRHRFDETELELLREVIEMIKASVERISVEESLKRSEEKYRLLAENVRDIIWTTDLNLNFTYLSPSIEKVFGYTPEEFRKLNPEDYLTPDSVEIVNKVLPDELSSYKMGGKIVSRTLELEAYRKDGSKLWIELNATLLVDSKGKPYGIIGITRDITERKKMEKALKEEKEKYRTIFENTGTAMAIIEEDMTISMVNSEFERISGYRRDEIEGRKWTDFVHPEEVERMKKYHYARRKGAEVPKKYESRAIDKYGNVRDILITVDVIPGTERSVISVIDITPIKKKNKLLKAISRINEIVSRQKNPETTLKAVCDNFKNVYESAFASLFEDKGLISVAMEGIDSKSVKNSLNSCPSIIDAIKGKTGKMRTDDPSCKNCTINKHRYVLSVPLIYRKNYGILSIHSNSEFSDEEVELLEKLAVNIAFSLNAYEVESDRRSALEQLAKNLQQFDRTADRLRNPLAVVISSLELMDEIGKEKAIDMVRKQAFRIKNELDELRKEEIATYKLIEKSFKKFEKLSKA